MTHSPQRRFNNRLLDRLPADDRDRLAAHLQEVELPVGKGLYDAGSKQSHLYFPCSGVVSLLYVLESGNTGEIAMVGNEGVVGITLLVDSNKTPTSAEVQVAGRAYMLKAEIADQEFHRNGAFQLLILRYTQLMLSQMAQSVVCNRHHVMERQACRWLLSAFDRAGGNELLLTQESIARLLGVRREGVSEVARRLQEAEVISCSRGRIRLIDREALEDRSCECYDIVRDEYDRLLEAPLPTEAYV